MEDKVYKFGEYPPGLENRIVKVLSDILSDKYGVKINAITLRQKDGSVVRHDVSNQTCVHGV